MPIAHEAHINDYPPERNYAREATGISIGVHIAFLVLIGILALIFHIQSLRDLMLKGGSLELAPPPPEERIEVTLQDILPPPPPLKTPEFIRELVKPPPPPPKPVAVKKPQPKPVPVVHDNNAMVSHLVVGTSGLPHPGYPMRAQLMHITGEVVMTVTFDAEGNAVNAEVTKSSGSSLLDSPTRDFILEHWHNESFAGRTETVPIDYVLEAGPQ